MDSESLCQQFEGKVRILLVEDNALNQKVFKIMLEDLGCIVDIASTGTEALAKLRGSYDLVLMDVGLPDISGLEVTRTYIDDMSTPENRMPVLALTGHALAEDKQMCMEAGMDDYLIKPLLKHDLTVAVNKWVKVPS